MKITITADEAMDIGVWNEICDLKGYNPWCVNEGLMDGDHEIKLTEKEAKDMGVLKK